MLSVIAAQPFARPALIMAEDGRSLSFGELHDAVLRLGSQLAAIGAGRGDRIALALPNGATLVEALLAIMAIGAGAAPLNPSYTRREFEFHLASLAPRLLLLPEGDIAAARAAAGSSTPVVDVASREPDPPSMSLGRRPLAQEAAFDPAVPDDVALMLHTSGTTGRPKRVPLLHRNLVASATIIARHYRLTEADLSFSMMPLYHVHGIVASVLAAMAGGGSVVVPRRFTPTRFWPQARERCITWFSATPTLHTMILAEADAAGAPSSLRFVRSCSAPLSEPQMRQAEDVYGVPVLEAYGMTEMSHQIASNPLPPGRRVPGSVGIPTGSEVRILDETGQDVPEHRPGEVVVRGPGLMPAYANNSGANDEAFVDGWFRTGDIGTLEDGYLRLLGRSKEMILRGGENIFPLEIEHVLLAHEAVADAACFAIDDEVYGEEIAVAVTLRAHVDEALLRSHCRAHLAPSKVPRTIRIVEELPRSATGKLDRRHLASLLETRRL